MKYCVSLPLALDFTGKTNRTFCNNSPLGLMIHDKKANIIDNG